MINLGVELSISRYQSKKSFVLNSGVATDVAAGTDHICYLESSAVTCVGNNSAGQTTVPSLTSPQSVYAGADWSCGWYLFLLGQQGWMVRTKYCSLDLVLPSELLVFWNILLVPQALDLLMRFRAFLFPVAKNHGVWKPSPVCKSLQTKTDLKTLAQLG